MRNDVAELGGQEGPPLVIDPDRSVVGDRDREIQGLVGAGGRRTALDGQVGAVALGQDRSALAPLRERLRANRESCVLFDMPLLVRELETLYRKMWETCEQGRLPRPDLANLDVYLEVGGKAGHEGAGVQLIGDYHGWWSERLAARHGSRPIEPDRRLVMGPRFA